jgi:nitrogen fixation protein FixH
MGEQVVSLVLDVPRPAGEAARERLAETLGSDGTVGKADPDTGVFDVTVDADSREDALHRVWNALAASGADDQILFLEHPDIPGHWRTKQA